MRRSGQFFSIDVFVAVAIIGVGMFVLFTTRPVQISPTQTATLSADLMASLDSITVTEVNSNYVYDQLLSGNISNTGNTILQQIGEYYVYGRIDRARNLTVEVTQGAIPLQYAFALYINNTLIFESRPFDDRSPNLVSTKRILSGIKNETAFWGPVPAEVRVWR